MKRVDLLLPDKIANNVALYKQAEEILTWSKAIVKLVDMGLRYYCDADRVKEAKQISNMMKSMDHIVNMNRELSARINNYIEENKQKSKEEENK